MAITFEIQDRRHGADAHVVTVAGEIDIFTAPELKQRVAAAIDSGAETVVVDLSGTTFIDSSSLGILIGAHRRVEHRHGRFVVACDNPAIVKTFKITGLDQVFAIVPTVQDAVDDSGQSG